MSALKVVLVVGTDPEILEYQSRRIAARNREAGYSCTVFDLNQNRFADVENNLAQASLFAQKEFLWLKNAQALSTSELRDLEERLKEGNIKPLLISAHEKPANIKRWEEISAIPGVKLYRIEDKGKEHLEFCAREIARVAKKHGKALTREVPELILEKTNGSFLAAVHEMEKLCLYYDREKVITPRMVERFTATTTTIRMFDFIDAFLRRDLRAAAVKLDDLFLAGEKPEAIFYVLLSVYTDFVTVIVADKSGRRLGETVKLTGLREWQVEKYRRLASTGKWTEFAEIYWKLLKFDTKIKTGRVRRLDTGLKRLLTETL